jgi:decaprenylphospho-beta-D-erythro-pentofuranosid-2-ulose 2-reductase
MKNGVGVAQSIVLFGGTSDIGQAIIHKLVKPGVSHVVLVSRDIDASAQQMDEISERFPDLELHHVRFDAADSGSMVHVVDEVVQQVGDIDIAVIAQGVLQEGDDYYANPVALQPVADVNFTGSMVLMYALAARMRSQGYGKMVLLSSVAGERVRKGNPVYGATKAGIDGFALALDHELVGSGVSILVVRPGFVTTKMTKGMDKAPFSTDAEAVAAAVAKAVGTSKAVIWVPGLLQYMFVILKNLPIAIWRRLPL